MKNVLNQITKVGAFKTTEYAIPTNSFGMLISPAGPGVYRGQREGYFVCLLLKGEQRLL